MNTPSINNIENINYDFKKTEIENKVIFEYFKNDTLCAQIILKEEGDKLFLSHRLTEFQYRRQGLGSKLLSFAKEYAKENDKSIYLKTSQIGVINWAIKNGFNSNQQLPNQNNLKELGLKEQTIIMPTTEEKEKVLVKVNENLSTEPTLEECSKKCPRYTLQISNALTIQKMTNTRINKLTEQ